MRKNMNRRFFNKFKSINADDLKVSSYFKKNIKIKIRNLKYEVKKYTHILKTLFRFNEKSLSDYVFVDYGAGYGLLALMAKEMGVGTVIYNDINESYKNDFDELSKSIGIPCDYLHVGDIDSLNSYLKENHLKVNGLASYDVLEHIYDIEEWVYKLNQMPSENLVVVKGSGANLENPDIAYPLMMSSYYNENNDREFQEGSNEVDCYESYLKAREKIIRNNFSDLDDIMVELLAIKTRGKRVEDIIQLVSKYIKSGQMPIEIDHPTNTCNPYTGSWDEHFIDHNYLTELFTENGFQTHIESGIIDNKFSLSIHYIQRKYYNFKIESGSNQYIRYAPSYNVIARKNG